MKVRLLDLRADGLIFREHDQVNMAFVREMVREMGVIPPITAGQTADGYVIIDGHHRARVAQEMGCTIPAAVIDEGDYQRLLSQGYDMNAISAAMLLAVGDSDGANELLASDRRPGILDQAWTLFDMINEK